MNKFFLISATLIFQLTSCSKSSEDRLQNPVLCDTTDVQYKADVLPVIAANCYRCHGAGIEEGDVNLEGYDNLKAYGENGDLVGVISHSSGYPPMPQDGDKLSDCAIAVITAWVNEGMPNN